MTFCKSPFESRHSPKAKFRNNLFEGLPKEADTNWILSISGTGLIPSSSPMLLLQQSRLVHDKKYSLQVY